MGTCTYCKKPAGFLRSVHPECMARHSGSLKRIRSELAGALRSTDNFDSVLLRVERFAETGNLSTDDITKALVSEWEEAVGHFLDDGELDAAEEHRLTRYIEQFKLTKPDLDRNGALTTLAKAGAIRELLEGRLPQRMAVQGSLPINFLKSETVVWAFKDATYLEDKNQRTYVGGSQGFSVRVMKGLYYRASAFKGQAIDRTVRVAIDEGLVVVTDKNVYFAGGRKSLRVPYSKIVSFQPFGDGIGIVRDAANAKLQIFATGDGWFIHNLVVNLARMASDA